MLYIPIYGVTLQAFTVKAVGKSELVGRVILKVFIIGIAWTERKEAHQIICALGAIIKPQIPNRYTKIVALK